MQRVCPVDHALTARYASVKRNQKGAMTARESHNYLFLSVKNYHDFPSLRNISAHCIASHASVKHNKKSQQQPENRMLFFSGNIFHDVCNYSPRFAYYFFDVNFFSGFLLILYQSFLLIISNFEHQLCELKN